MLTPAEQLHGVWRTVGPYGQHDADGEWVIVGDTISTLTFTTEGRWIYHEINLIEGERVDGHVNQGGWTATAEVISATGLVYENDTEREVTIDHSYALVGDDLFVVDWFNHDEARPPYQRWTGASLPDSIIGVWVRQQDDPFIRTTMTVNADGTLRYVQERTSGVFTVTGRWRDGKSGALVLLVTDPMSTWDPHAEDEPDEVDEHPGAEWRLAYAPTNQAGNIMVSPFWNEAGYSSDRFIRQHGNYYRIFAMQ